MTGDFSLEVKMDLLKNSDQHSVPDRGYQQSGILIRPSSSQKENHISLAIGTNGNKNRKLILTNTVNNKSKTTTIDLHKASSWLKLEKKGLLIFVYIKADSTSHWHLHRKLEIKWNDAECQAGLFGLAHFPGDGPRMYPDIRAIFSYIKLVNL
jgi:hypothetical protein